MQSLANIVQRGMRPAMKKAGIVDAAGNPKYSGLHVFRHWFASWSINPKDQGGRGLDLKTVQTLLGHATLSLTADTYSHLFPRKDEAAELDAAELALG